MLLKLVRYIMTRTKTEDKVQTELTRGRKTSGQSQLRVGETKYFQTKHNNNDH